MVQVLSLIFYHLVGRFTLPALILQGLEMMLAGKS